MMFERGTQMAHVYGNVSNIIVYSNFEILFLDLIGCSFQMLNRN